MMENAVTIVQELEGKLGTLKKRVREAELSAKPQDSKVVAALQYVAHAAKAVRFAFDNEMNITSAMVALRDALDGLEIVKKESDAA